MTTDFISTGKQIKFENGKTFFVYSKETKKGVRYYFQTIGRMLPISLERFNELTIK